MLVISVAFGSAMSFVEPTARFVQNAPESVWMLLWGLVLFSIGLGARLLLERRRRSSLLETQPVARPKKTAHVRSPKTWREAMVAKLMADRARALDAQLEHMLQSRG